MNTTAVIRCSIGIAAVASLIVWRLQVPVPPTIERYALVDLSRSDAAPCAALGALVEKTIVRSTDGFWRFFATGSAATALEPISIPIQLAPAGPRLMEGKDIADRQNAAFINDVI